MAIAVIGLGNMGGAMVSGLRAAGVGVAGYDVDASRAAALGCTPLADVASAAGCDLVLVAVKPPLVAGVVSQLADAGARVVVSVAAGVSLASLAAAASGSTSVVLRAMPNTAAAVGASTTALVAAADCPDWARAEVEAAFAHIGSAFWLSSEAQIHVATAVVGSAPAFLYVFAEALADGAVVEGMPRAQARSAVASMLLGAAQLLRSHDGSPATLKDAVASPGGTTIAGLRALEDARFRAAAIDAICATAARSRALS